VRLTEAKNWLTTASGDFVWALWCDAQSTATLRSRKPHTIAFGRKIYSNRANTFPARHTLRSDAMILRREEMPDGHGTGRGSSRFSAGSLQGYEARFASAIVHERPAGPLQINEC
jgi:hypothetical protein